ncbi:MAG: polyketide cyclase / dehydrase family protein [bacterium]|nr:polyketide cyclase / dehydrase family protein [bacterium]
MRLLVVLLVAAVQFGDVDARDGWAAYGTRDGVTLERRKVDGSRYYEHRAWVDVEGVPPERAATEIWKALRGGDMDSLKHRDILAEREDELVIYDQIRTPVVSDRDYTIVETRRRDGANGKVRFECVTANDRGPAAAKGYVRIPLIRAGWSVEADGRGGTRLGYFAYSEVGGSVPAWMVRGAQADRSMADVVRMVARLRGAR